MRKFHYFLFALILVMLGVSSAFFYGFTAEDAYITYRYAENWVNTGHLIYNMGEPINALTSPLHAILSAGFFLITGNTVLSNKLFSFTLLCVSAILVWSRYKGQPHWQVLALSLMTPPCVLLWTFGGLETPILFFLATVAVILTISFLPSKPNLLILIFVLAGLAFLTRFDSILFFLPLVLYATSKTRSIKLIAISLAVAAILPLTWLIVSYFYYGDLLPTSFYVKTPKGNLWGLIFNAEYIVSYLIYIGVIPAAALALFLLRPRHKLAEVLVSHFKSSWWLYFAILLELSYGLTMATHHMMFSFRFFVPYLPATAILVVDFFRHATESSQIDLIHGKPSYLFTGFLIGLVLFQLYQNVYTYNHSINGISRIGEYRALGVRDYVSYMQILNQEAVDIERHWDIHGDNSRQPRIITYAAGMLPYTYRDSYIYEKLVSYRHCQQRYQQGLYADYLHILAPRQGSVNEQLPKAESSYTLVSTYQLFFDGSMQDFLVYYNPDPEEHNLSAGINEPCEEAGESAD